VGSESSNGNYVYLKFDENFTIDSGEVEAIAYLKSKMSIATDGVNFVPLPELSQVSQNSSRVIRVYYENDMQVILGTNTLIKIQSGTLKDAAGNLNDEMILHVTPPVIQSAEISSDFHDVTITFDGEVYDNTINNEVSYLRDYIYLLRNGVESDWEGMTEGDTVSIDSNKLIVHFAKPLTGDENLIIMEDGALKDSNGNIPTIIYQLPL
jgi:hypothetical protein